jgi:hypothetical protein
MGSLLGRLRSDSSAPPVWQLWHSEPIKRKQLAALLLEDVDCVELLLLDLVCTTGEANKAEAVVRTAYGLLPAWWQNLLWVDLEAWESYFAQLPVYMAAHHAHVTYDMQRQLASQLYFNNHAENMSTLCKALHRRMMTSAALFENDDPSAVLVATGEREARKRMERSDNVLYALVIAEVRRILGLPTTNEAFPIPPPTER